MVRLYEEHDAAGAVEPMAEAEGRAAMEEVTASLDRFKAEAAAAHSQV